MQGTLARSVEILLEHEAKESTRFCDLAISLRVCDVTTDGPEPEWIPSTDEELIEVGGRWDRRRKRWGGEAARVRVVRVPRGSDQEQPARWLAEWFRRTAQGAKGPHWSQPVTIPGRISVAFRRVWTLMLIGGRRSGKSHLAVVALVMMLVTCPRSIVWAVSPTQEESDELEQAARTLMPSRWFTARLAGAGKALQFKLANGSRLLFLSGHKPRSLKRGRCDVALYNEAQNMYRAGWRQLRGAIADKAGIVILSCNPPDAEIGRWVTDVFERARAQKIEAEAFTLTAERNPFADWTALQAMALEEDDELTYRREVLGEIVPIGDVVFHAWSDAESIIDRPDPSWVDVTREETKRELGREFDYIVGEDYQATPHMVAVLHKLFRDRDGDLIDVVVDEIVIEEADENELVDGLEAKRPDVMPGRVVFAKVIAKDPAGGAITGWTVTREEGVGYDPEACGQVVDATGITTQDGAHSKPQRTSADWLKARGWRWLFFPDRSAKRNPDIVERVKVTNARLKNAAGKRRMFALRHCLRVHRAMRSWENRGGAPYRKSPYAHICDAVSYPVYRFFARSKARNEDAVTYTPIKRARRAPRGFV